MRVDEDNLEMLDDEAAVVKMLRVCGENNNPIGFYREALATHGNKVDFKSLKDKGYLKVSVSNGTLGYYSSWIQLSNKAKNLYKRVNIKYRWSY